MCLGSITANDNVVIETAEAPTTNLPTNAVAMKRGPQKKYTDEEIVEFLIKRHMKQHFKS